MSEHPVQHEQLCWCNHQWSRWLMIPVYIHIIVVVVIIAERVSVAIQKNWPPYDGVHVAALTALMTLGSSQCVTLSRLTLHPHHPYPSPVVTWASRTKYIILIYHRERTTPWIRHPLLRWIPREPQWFRSNTITSTMSHLCIRPTRFSTRVSPSKRCFTNI